MDDEAERQHGLIGAAWRVDRFLRDHIGRPYRIVLAAGLMVGIGESVDHVQKALGSPANIVQAIVTIVFEAALLLNQLAQVHERRTGRRQRKSPARSD